MTKLKNEKFDIIVTPKRAWITFNLKSSAKAAIALEKNKRENVFMKSDFVEVGDPFDDDTEIGKLSFKKAKDPKNIHWANCS